LTRAVVGVSALTLSPCRPLQVNYGENYVPLDYLFGSFDDGSRFNKDKAK
jgi:hypothetical protein